ncbi:MAG: hypothetical protein WCT08_06260 [Patescibacteria group bacterium]|jgi:hypothetical protein
MKKRSILNTESIWSNMWTDEYKRYPVLIYVVVCLVMLELKLGHRYEMTWSDALLLEIMVAIILVIRYVFGGLNALIPESIKNRRAWRAYNETFISKKPSALSAGMAQFTYLLCQFYWWYGIRVSESRSRQDYWNTHDFNNLAWKKALEKQKSALIRT